MSICDFLDAEQRWQERMMGRAGQTLTRGETMMGNREKRCREIQVQIHS